MTSVGRGSRPDDGAGRSAPRCTTSVLIPGPPSSRQRRSAQPELAITRSASRSVVAVTRRASRLASAACVMSGPWVETTRAARRRDRRTAWPTGRIDCACTRSNGRRSCRRASARASAGAIHQPQLPYDHGRGGATNGTGSTGMPSSSKRSSSPGTLRAHSRRPGSPRRAAEIGGTGRRMASTRTSAPASRAATACRWAQTPRTGSTGDGYHSATTATRMQWTLGLPASAAQSSRPPPCRTESRCSAGSPSG